MIVSQSSAPRGASVTLPEAKAGHVLTEVAGHTFVSTVDPKPVGPFILGREFAAKVDLGAPNAILHLLPDGPRYLVKVTPLDGGQHMPGGTFETEAGGPLVSIVPLARRRLK